MSMKSCETCQYSVMELWLFCRRYPPIQPTNEDTRFPQVHATDWCGEYQPKEHQ